MLKGVTAACYLSPMGNAVNKFPLANLVVYRDALSLIVGRSRVVLISPVSLMRIGNARIMLYRRLPPISKP